MLNRVNTVIQFKVVDEQLKKVFFSQIYAWSGPRVLRILDFGEELLRLLLEIPPDAIRVQVAERGVSRGVVVGLEPWTEYNVAVQGYNNAGLGPTSDEVLSVTTLDWSKWGASRC